MTGPQCGVPHHDYPDTVCTEPAGHYQPGQDPHAGPLIIDGRECGGAAWDEPKEPRMNSGNTPNLNEGCEEFTPEVKTARPTGDHLRNRIAKALEREDALNCGYDHSFVNTYGVDPETDGFVDAMLAALLDGAEREPRVKLDDLNSDRLDGLYDDLDRYGEVLGEMNETIINQERELAALRLVSRGYCPACGRGDAAPTVADWEQQKQRANQLAAVLDEVLRHFTFPGHPGQPCLSSGWISTRTVEHWRNALNDTTTKEN